MKENLAPDMQNAATEIGRSMDSKSNVRTKYKDQLLDPKADEDFELLHYIYQAKDKGLNMKEVDRLITVKLKGFIYSNFSNNR